MSGINAKQIFLGVIFVLIILLLIIDHDHGQLFCCGSGYILPNAEFMKIPIEN